MLAAMGRMAVPSVKHKTLTSGPSRNSSTTTRLPEAPNLPFFIISVTAASACAFVSQMSTPLPSASPSALTTTGHGTVRT